MKSKISTFPVSGSYSISAIDPAKDPPTFFGLIDPVPAIDPPLPSNSLAYSLKVIFNIGSDLELN